MSHTKKKLQKGGQFLAKDFFSTIWYTLVLPMWMHFNGYFYNCKSNVKFCGNFMSFVVGNFIFIFLSFLLYEKIFFCMYLFYVFPFIPLAPP